MLFNTNENSLPQQVIINKEDIKTLDTRVAYLEALEGVGSTESIVNVIQVDESNYDNLPTDKTSFYGISYYQNQKVLSYEYGTLIFYGNTIKVERALNDNVLYQKVDMINSEDNTDRLYIYRLYNYVTLSWSEWYREPSRDEIITIKADIEVNKSNISILTDNIGNLESVNTLVIDLGNPAFNCSIAYSKTGIEIRIYCNTVGEILLAGSYSLPITATNFINGGFSFLSNSSGVTTVNGFRISGSTLQILNDITTTSTYQYGSQTKICNITPNAITISNYDNKYISIRTPITESDLHE